MHLKELSLIDYRNYVKLELKFSSNLIVLSGRNAQGKTNILESIFLSSTGRSHRTPRDRELIRWGQKESVIRSLVDKREGPSLIEITLSQKDKKKININSMTAQRLGELMGHINSVLFSPEDLKLVKGSPTERRRFMDMEISQVRPKYFYSLQQYNRLLNHRNNLLKEINENSSLKKTLPVWDEQIAKVGSYIIMQRLAFIESIKKIAKEVHKEISLEKEDLDIAYNSSINFDSDDASGIVEDYLKELESNHEEDIKKGRTEKGCHRDDLSICINGVDVKTFGSQGQQRSTVLSLKLSEIELMFKQTGEYPLLLLDDVMSELDKFRQSKLLSYFNRVQTFMTMTDYSDLPNEINSNMEIYEVFGGKVAKI
ncbi:MAG: DNA replication/repair protein RecF [Caldicoprobacterales bacterium]|nr:DNA replication/repair protein RecF [Clostridiales bacterium]